MRIACPGERFEGRPTWIVEAEKLGGLVECLPGRVVDRRCKAAIVADPADLEQLAMAAGDEQEKVGKIEVRIDQSRTERMSFQMVDRDERLTGRERQSL